MTRITILGGTGYAGGGIAREAASRGHDVTVFSRNPPANPIDNVVSVTGSALNRGDIERAVAGSEVIVTSLAPVGDLEESYEQVNGEIADIARRNGARLGVVGGAGTLLVAPGGPKVYELPEFPEQFREFSRVSDAVLDALRSSDQELDWFVLSPAQGFGHYAPGERVGEFRLGSDLVMGRDAAISGADYSIAFVDEIERPTKRRERFTVAY